MFGLTFLGVVALLSNVDASISVVSVVNYNGLCANHQPLAPASLMVADNACHQLLGETNGNGQGAIANCQTGLVTLYTDSKCKVPNNTLALSVGTCVDGIGSKGTAEGIKLVCSVPPVNATTLLQMTVGAGCTAGSGGSPDTLSYSVTIGVAGCQRMPSLFNAQVKNFETFGVANILPAGDYYQVVQAGKFVTVTFYTDVNCTVFDTTQTENPIEGFIGSCSETVAPTTNGPTKSPVTKAPTTNGPTKSPVTKAPTTNGPTKSPVTKAPTTNGPTKSPVTKSPTTSGPTKSPVTKSPTSNAPTKSPVTKAPTTNGPTKSPVTKAPTTNGPTKSPVTKAPTTNGPTKSPVKTSAPTSSPTGKFSVTFSQIQGTGVATNAPTPSTTSAAAASFVGTFAVSALLAVVFLMV